METRKLIYNQEQTTVLQYALSELIELLKSPTSADRDADPALADRQIEVATHLLANMQQSQDSLKQAVSSLQAIKRYDSVVDDEANDGANARAPDGSDYNEVFDHAMVALACITPLDDRQTESVGANFDAEGVEKKTEWTDRYAESHELEDDGDKGDGDNAGVNLILEAAEAHGTNTEAVHEVGDLQNALRAAWAIMNPAQRVGLLRSSFMAELLENELPASEDGTSSRVRVETVANAQLAAEARRLTLYDLLVESFPGFEEGSDVSGSDLVDWCNVNLERFRSSALE